METDAFLLTRRWRDTSGGVELTYWATSPEGPLRLRFPNERAVLFVEAGTKVERGDRQPSDLRSLRGSEVDAVYFDAQAALVQERTRLWEDLRPPMESDIKPADRFLMERFITGACRVRGTPQKRSGYLELRGPKIRRSEYRPDLRPFSFDIETDGADGKLLSIAAVSPGRSEVFLLGPGPELANVARFDDESQLLEAFASHLRQIDPDVLLGWNLIEFDLRYLLERAERLGVSFTLGRDAGRSVVLAPRSSTQPYVARIPGRVVLDGIALLRTATYSFEQFGLGYVAQQLLGKDKAIAADGNDGEAKVAEIRRMYREDQAALVQYNLSDAQLVQEIFDHTDLLSFAVERQFLTGLPLDRQGGSVAAFDHLYLPRLHRAGYVAPDVGPGLAAEISPGGYVLDSVPGLYRNVLVLDFKSLYPSIIRTFRIDPLGMAVPGETPIEGFDGAEFSRETHILPGLIEELWEARDKAKRDSNAALSRAIKILMNSFYGVLGTTGCRFHSHRLASSITRRGHQILKESRHYIVDRGHPVIYGDTDSLFIDLSELSSSERAVEVGLDLARELTTWWAERIRTEHGVDSALEMEFDVLYERFFMPTTRGADAGSKKRYAGLPHGKHKVVVRGLEAVRSDWTPLARRFQRELLRRVFTDEAYEDYCQRVVNDMYEGKLDTELVYRKRLRRDLDEYTGAMPPHVVAAKKLGKRLRFIQYVITTRGPEPIERLESPVDYDHYFKKQLGPVADGVLRCFKTNLDRIAGRQLSLL
ncbi:MAG: DNA polymerase II [Myxococcota bacterium]